MAPVRRLLAINDDVSMHATQVHGTNNGREISDGISRRGSVVYRRTQERVPGSPAPPHYESACLFAAKGVCHMSVGPTVRRRRLGSELRRLGESDWIKLEEVAERLGLAPSTLSRIETGKAPTRTAYLISLFDLYGVDDPSQRQVLLEMAREGHRKGWWAVWDGVLPTGFGIWGGLEAEAASLRVYDAQVVHGLLQTEDYARAVMSTVRRRQTPEEIDRLVQLQMQRQEVLTRPDPLALWIILDEAVLRRMVRPSRVMREQLDHLYETSQLPNVTLQVLAFSSGLPTGMGAPCAIIEFPQRSHPDVVS